MGGMRVRRSRGQGSPGQEAGINSIMGGVYDLQEVVKVGQLAVNSSDGRGCNRFDGEAPGGKDSRANHRLTGG